METAQITVYRRHRDTHTQDTHLLCDGLHATSLCVSWSSYPRWPPVWVYTPPSLHPRPGIVSDQTYKAWRWSQSETALISVQPSPCLYYICTWSIYCRHTCMRWRASQVCIYLYTPVQTHTRVAACTLSIWALAARWMSVIETMTMYMYTSGGWWQWQCTCTCRVGSKTRFRIKQRFKPARIKQV